LLTKLFIGLPIFLVSSYLGLTYYRVSQVPFKIVITLAVIKSVICMFCIFYNVDWIIKQLQRWRVSRWLLNKWQRLMRFSDNHNSFSVKSHKKGIQEWLSRRKKWLLILLIFVPYVPLFPSGVIITVRQRRIKYALIPLTLGAIFRAAISCWSFYPHG